MSSAPQRRNMFKKSETCRDQTKSPAKLRETDRMKESYVVLVVYTDKIPSFPPSFLPFTLPFSKFTVAIFAITVTPFHTEHTSQNTNENKLMSSRPFLFLQLSIVNYAIFESFLSLTKFHVYCVAANSILFTKASFGS